MSKTKPAGVPPEKDEHAELVHILEDWPYSTTPKIALLMKWFHAEGYADEYAGSEDRLATLAWRGAEMVLRDVLRDIETVLRFSEAQTDGHVTLADEKDGAE